MRRFKGVKDGAVVVQGVVFASWVAYETPTGARDSKPTLVDVCEVVGIIVNDVVFLDAIA